MAEIKQWICLAPNGNHVSISVHGRPGDMDFKNGQIIQDEVIARQFPNIFRPYQAKKVASAPEVTPEPKKVQEKPEVTPEPKKVQETPVETAKESPSVVEEKPATVKTTTKKTIKKTIKKTKK